MRLIKPKTGVIPIDFSELFRYRELFVFLVWRDILIRYKQTLLGVAWAIIQPLSMMVVFSTIFGGLAKMPSADAPYPIMTYAALIPWNYFANALSMSSNSMISSANLVSKVYFPRIILPSSAAMAGLVDMGISFSILFLLMIYYSVKFQLLILLLPMFTLLALMTALGCGLWLSALNVRYRDVKYIVPFIVSMGLFISPVGFMSDMIPEKWQFLYSLNPMVGVIDGFRWCILGDNFEPYWQGLFFSILAAMALFVSGAYFFKNIERHFADVI